MRTKEGGLFLSQSFYIQDVLVRFKTHLPGPGARLNGAETLMDHRIWLHKNEATQLRFKPNDKDIEKGAEKCGADISYREVVGPLLRLANGTRQDISFAVNKVAKYCGDPRVAHCLLCVESLKGFDVNIESYVDADFANCVDDGHSMLAGGPISWQSKSQATVALSTMEAE